MASLQEIDILLSSKLEEHKQSILKVLNETIAANNERVTILEEQIKTLTEQNTEKDTTMQSVLMKMTDMENKINSLEEQVDHQINRNLRTTLVVKGLKEEKKETWEITEKK